VTSGWTVINSVRSKAMVSWIAEESAPAGADDDKQDQAGCLPKMS
jgi:hypothetical protein